MASRDPQAKTRKPSTAHKHGGLKELPATAICGNDITSSVLYVSALSIIAGGKWACVSLLIVAAVLFLFRGIYAEVVGALPLNGGAYNALLNTTSKRWASIAACLTILSYMATAVISAGEAMHYAHGLWHGLNIFWATIVLMAIFMALTIIGIQESSRVSVGIFLFHLASLTLLVAVIGIYLSRHGLSVLSLNMATPTESVPKALFFGFAAALLGISGFESSSNFVEEQAEGVFPKTLRNMWVAVSVFNPLMAFLALAIVPIGEVHAHQEDLLAHMGNLAGGQWLSYIVSVDATLVLSGAVLTSFVGVTGLIKRMTLDRVLPFLSVMALFGIGNVLLKVKRARLPRPSRAPWPVVILGIAAVLVGLAGTYAGNPEYFWVFLQYFIPTVLVAFVMLGRIGLLKVCLYFIRRISQTIAGITSSVAKGLHDKIDEINSQQIVFFTRGDSKQ